MVGVPNASVRSLARPIRDDREIIRLRRRRCRCWLAMRAWPLRTSSADGLVERAAADGFDDFVRQQIVEQAVAGQHQRVARAISIGGPISIRICSEPITFEITCRSS